MKTYNLYCDESCHLENDGHLFMFLAYTRVLNNRLRFHKSNIKKLKNKYHCYGEIKWNKVSKSQENFYLALVDYFFETDLSFRAIAIRKSDIKKVADFNSEEFYYKMYYRLIYHKLDLLNKYNIYNDIMDTRSINRIFNLKNLLQTQFVNLGNFQYIRSHESIFIQITDFIMGAVSYYLRGGVKVQAKVNIISKIIEYANHDLKKSTTNSKDKFDLYHIELGK